MLIAWFVAIQCVFCHSLPYPPFYILKRDNIIQLHFLAAHLAVSSSLEMMDTNHQLSE